MNYDTLWSVVSFLKYSEAAAIRRVSTLWYRVNTDYLCNIPKPRTIHQCIIDSGIETRFQLWQMYNALRVILKDFDTYSFGGDSTNIWYQESYLYLNKLIKSKGFWHYGFRRRIMLLFHILTEDHPCQQVAGDPQGILLQNPKKHRRFTKYLFGQWVSYFNYGADMVILYQIFKYIRSQDYIGKYPDLYPPEVQTESEIRQHFLTDAKTYPPLEYLFRYPWHYTTAQEYEKKIQKTLEKPTLRQQFKQWLPYRADHIDEMLQVCHELWEKEPIDMIHFRMQPVLPEPLYAFLYGTDLFAGERENSVYWPKYFLPKYWLLEIPPSLQWFNCRYPNARPNGHFIHI